MLFCDFLLLFPVMGFCFTTLEDFARESFIEISMKIEICSMLRWEVNTFFDFNLVVFFDDV